MVVGIALVVVGSLGTIGVIASLLASTPPGSVELGSLVALDPRSALFATAVVAFASAIALASGIHALVRVRGRRARVAAMDERARAAEEEARGRLLGLRLTQLEAEVGLLEARRAAALGELPAPMEGDAEILVLVPEREEPTELGRRLAATSRTRALQR
jgi:hypothetical protein